jgi:hypothetical protein
MILSGKLKPSNYHTFPALEQNPGNHKFNEDREVKSCHTMCDNTSQTDINREEKI